MSAIASSDVTYSEQSKTIGDSGMRTFIQSIAFGNSTLTYPSGGIPLDANKMGCPNRILSVKIVDPGNGNGFVYKYKPSTNCVRIYQTATLTPAGSVSTPAGTVSTPAGTISAHTHTIPSGTDSGGGTSGSTTPTFTGSASTFTGSASTFTGTATTAAAMSELGGAAAPAATTLVIEIVGW